MRFENDIVGLLLFFFRTLLWLVGAENAKKLLAMVCYWFFVCSYNRHSFDDKKRESLP
jgi:hypothetical protein